MKYAIKVNELRESEGSTRGLVTVTFGGVFKVSSIAIMEKRGEGTLFVSMPRYKSNEVGESGETVYKDICYPITREFRSELYENILEAFEQECERNWQRENGAHIPRESAESDMEPPVITATVTPFEKEGSRIRGLARICIDDCFVINNISIMQGKNGLFVTMPSYKTQKQDEAGNPIYQDVCFPTTKEFKQILQDKVIEAYKVAVEKKRAESETTSKTEEAKPEKKSSTDKKEDKSDGPEKTTNEKKPKR